ncbi:class I SAM-dependent methyltransferase [Hymenobacter sp. B1770]|uniref:class I SAM-dependent methyltransferase n=1 Tax=Hymenobacter sp. B1770 TaxID=1718788 RepID=UPI003CEA8C2E
MLPTPASNPVLAKPDYGDVPRGNTQKNVNREVLRLVLERSGLGPTSKVLDTSCGDGEFLTALRRYWPAASLTGCDIKPTLPAVAGLRYEQVDLTQPFDLTDSGKPFDLITSISGVMMFGNTRTFIESCVRQLRPGGVLVVTNDNVLAVRDRLSYLFLGRVRRFKLLFNHDEAITQFVQQQELKRLLERNGVELQEVVYTSFYAEDLLFLPFALLVFPFQWFYLRRLRNHTGHALRQQLFGFRSLLGRHYILVGRKHDNPAL